MPPLRALALLTVGLLMLSLLASPGATPIRAGVNAWTTGGPYNEYGGPDGGSVSTVVLDPTNPRTLYAATSLWGETNVYRSTDRGASWQPVGSGLPRGRITEL